MTPTATKVSVGLSTVFGLSAATASYIGAAISAAQGDHSQQTLALLGSGVLALASVIHSRGKQAVAHIHAAAARPAAVTLAPAKTAAGTVSSFAPAPAPVSQTLGTRAITPPVLPR